MKQIKKNLLKSPLLIVLFSKSGEYSNSSMLVHIEKWLNDCSVGYVFNCNHHKNMYWKGILIMIISPMKILTGPQAKIFYPLIRK